MLSVAQVALGPQFEEPWSKVRELLDPGAPGLVVSTHPHSPPSPSTPPSPGESAGSLGRPGRDSPGNLLASGQGHEGQVGEEEASQRASAGGQCPLSLPPGQHKPLRGSMAVVTASESAGEVRSPLCH